MLEVDIKLDYVFATLGAQAPGTQIETIVRQLFAVVMEHISEKCVQSVTATTTEAGDWNI